MQISAIIYIVLQLVVLWKMLYGKSLQNAGKYLIERVVDPLPLMTYGLKLSLEALILKFKNFDLRFKEII